MRIYKNPVKGVSVIIAIAFLFSLFPRNVAAAPLDLSGVSQAGSRVLQFVRSIGERLGDIKIRFGSGDEIEQVSQEIENKPEKVTVSLEPGRDSEIKSASRNITLKIPEGALTKQTDIEITEHTPGSKTGYPSVNALPMLRVIELKATDSVSSAAVSEFEVDLELRIRHTPEDLTGLDPDSLRLYYLNEKTGEWEAVPGSRYDRESGELIAGISHFSVYGEQGNPEIVGPGRIMASQVNLHAGTATFSYPLELPAGPGGFTPRLELTYNSGSADEMKDKKAVGSWVGIGWSFTLGQISYNAGSGEYFLDLNGASHKLLNISGNDYRTNPETYYKITRDTTNNKWTMYDREGNFYEFGGTTEAKQYITYYAAPVYYQWNLNLMQDTSGNKATITYVQDKVVKVTGSDEWVRSAYPQYLRYGYVDASNYKMEIVFNTASESGGARPDNPIDNTYYWEDELHVACTHLVHSGGHPVDQGWSACSNNSSHYPVYPPSYPQYPFWCDICNMMVNYQWYENLVYYPCYTQVPPCGPYSTGYQHEYDVVMIPHYDPYPAPKVMENRRLASVEVKVSGSLLRKYEFDYTTTDRYLSPGGQEYYAGTMKLNSITQKGSDGSTALPATSFTYQAMNTQYYTNVVYSWPHLTQVNSGYGGTISFTYTQKPATAPGNLWTRQAVTGKTVYGGNNDSDSQIYSYNYVGNIATSNPDPQYLGSDVNQKYRGFQQVTETDAGSHYAVYYFFTTGTIDGKDAEKLTGREYKTEWFNSSSQKLKDSLTDWIVYTIGSNWDIRNNKYETNTYKAGDVDTKKSTRVEYLYDSYGNVVTEKQHGDLDTTGDDLTIWRAFYPNTTANILGKTARERVYATIQASDDSGANLRNESVYYYDNNAAYTTSPAKALLTKVESKADAGTSVSRQMAYDTFGNLTSTTDANGNTTATTYDSVYHIYPVTQTYPDTDLNESATFQAGTGNILTHTNANGQVTSYYYDPLARLIKVVKPGDTENDPSITYSYLNWGTIGSQRLKAVTRIDAEESTWQAQYFDGLGRVIQTQSQGESGHTIIDSTVTFNNRGQVARQYVAQDIATADLTAYYNTGISGWKYSTAVYDALGRTTSRTGADGATVSNDYTNPWQTAAANPLGKITRYYYDAFARLVKVEEPDAGNNVYATTEYEYDTLGNLLTVTDDADNETTMAYDWLGRKTGMSDPDMGDWYYGYDAGGNLTWQVDAKMQAVNMYYDNMDRLKGKTYASGVSLPYTRPSDPGTGSYDVEYRYDSQTAGDNGDGQRTVMNDGSGSTAYTYDTRGRLSSETKTIDSIGYTTAYIYDGLNRIKTITYPTDETVTNTYNGRGLPDTVGGTAAGSLVTGTTYNPLGAITGINFGNGVTTTYSYWGIDHSTTNYGRLYEIQSVKSPTTLQDVTYAWDLNGNMTSRTDVLTSQTENFTYDSLDRLTAASLVGGYNHDYGYDTIGNLTARTYDDTITITFDYAGNHPHAIKGTAGLQPDYVYDANGNMTRRGNQAIGWDVENRVTGITNNNTTTQTRLVLEVPASATPGTPFDVTASLYTLPGQARINAAGLAVTIYYVIYVDGQVHDNSYIVAYTDAVGNAVGQLEAPGDHQTATIVIDAVYFGNNDYDTSSAMATVVTYAVNNPVLTAITNLGEVTFHLATEGGSPLPGQTINFAATAGTLTAASGATDASGDVTVTLTDTETALLTGAFYAAEIGGIVYQAAQIRVTVHTGNDPPTAQTRMAIDSPATAIPGTPFNVTASLYTSPGNEKIAVADLPFTFYYVIYVDGQVHDNTYTVVNTDAAGDAVAQLQLPGDHQTAIMVVDVVFFGDSSYDASSKMDNVATYTVNNAVLKATTSNTTIVFQLVAESGLALGGQTVYFSADSGTLSAATGVTDAYGNVSVDLTGTNAAIVSGSFYAAEIGGLIYQGTLTRITAHPGDTTAYFFYDGDGSRVKKIENGEIVVYVNGYYEKNVTTGDVTTYYYLGGKLVANRVNTTLTYVHQDSLNSTSLVTTDSGTLESAAAYLPFGGIRTGSVSTDQKFTGQRLDETGLYYYNARYYDATIGRFISPDTVVQNPANPQTLNRYSYCLNNPLKYTDPSGHVNEADFEGGWAADPGNPPPPPNPPTPAPKAAEPKMPLEDNEPEWPTFDNDSYVVLGFVAVAIAPADVVGIGGVVTLVAAIGVTCVWMYENQDEINKAIEYVSYHVSNWWDSLFVAESNAPLFPANPDNYYPPGLEKRVYETPNGKVVKWINPSTGESEYEYHEDKKNGPHYHDRTTGEDHIPPGANE